MPQQKVDFSTRNGYPGLVIRGQILRGYDSRFFNNTEWIIEYGSYLRYTNGREEGGVIAASAQSWEQWNIARSTCGIAVVSTPYLYDMMYAQQVNGYLPRAEVSVLQSGDVWLRPWTKVKAGEPVTYKRKPIRYTFLGEAATVGMYSGLVDPEGLRHVKLLGNSYWLTSAAAGELAIARVDFQGRIDPYVAGEDDDPFGF